MQMKQLGRLWPVSRLALGGGGLGMLWGATTREECVATFHDAVAAGVTLLDMAPRYGDGRAEVAVGRAFEGRLPAGVRVTSKCRLGDTPAGEVEATLRASVRGSLERMRLDQLDLFFLHCNVVPDDSPLRRHPEAAGRMVPAGRFRAAVRPALERLVADGTVGAWGLTGIGHPDTIAGLLAEQPQPAAVQCIANLLDSPGGLKFFDGPARPRELIGLAVGGGIGVMGIRAVQAGALTDRIDRPLAADHPEMRDFARAAGFRRLAADLGTGPAALAHRYALSIAGVDTVVLGVKNRAELADCIAAAEAGPLPPHLIARIDAPVPAD